MRVRSAAGLHCRDLLRIRNVGNVEDSYPAETVLLCNRKAASPRCLFFFILVRVFVLVGIFGCIFRLIGSLVFVGVRRFLVFAFFLIRRWWFGRESLFAAIQ